MKITDPTVKYNFGLGSPEGKSLRKKFGELLYETPLKSNLEGKLSKDVMQRRHQGLISLGSHGNECRAGVGCFSLSHLLGASLGRDQRGLWYF